jgi:hypothetical protein
VQVTGETVTLADVCTYKIPTYTKVNNYKYKNKLSGVREAKYPNVEATKSSRILASNRGKSYEPDWAPEVADGQSPLGRRHTRF